MNGKELNQVVFVIIFTNYQKSKKLLHEDSSKRAVNKIMAELGYKKIKSRGKW